MAYKKLRLLVDLGCHFVGHGLAKDFRTINIFVPPDQILDTVHLFALPGRSRKLSLRFLVWYLLKEDIQTGMHDSIEDARCAWLLYKTWKQLQEEGRFEEVMQEISDEGAKLVSLTRCAFVHADMAGIQATERSSTVTCARNLSASYSWHLPLAHASLNWWGATLALAAGATLPPVRLVWQLAQT